jgi:hypothetical protein
MSARQKWMQKSCNLKQKRRSDSRNKQKAVEIAVIVVIADIARNRKSKTHH